MIYDDWEYLANIEFKNAISINGENFFNLSLYSRSIYDGSESYIEYSLRANTKSEPFCTLIIEEYISILDVVPNLFGKTLEIWAEFDQFTYNYYRFSPRSTWERVSSKAIPYIEYVDASNVWDD